MASGISQRGLKDSDILEAVSSILVGESSRPGVLCESAEEKAAVERAVRSFLKKELPDSVTKQLKKALKEEDFESIVTAVTSKVLAKFFEIMWTRKSTWQSQLKAK